jgi:opacity protein-like surface antigen
MRVVLAAAMIALLTTAALAQDHVQQYGEADKDKSPAQIEADKEAQRAYQKSLNNIPDKGPADPWGAVRSDTPKTASSAASSAPAKTTKAKTKTHATN